MQSDMLVGSVLSDEDAVRRGPPFSTDHVNSVRKHASLHANGCVLAMDTVFETCWDPVSSIDDSSWLGREDLHLATRDLMLQGSSLSESV